MKRFRRITDLPTELQIEAEEITEIRSGLSCPACGGGRSRERSLSMWPDGLTVVMKCWRNGCGYSAAVPRRGDGKATPTKFTGRVYKGELWNASSDILGLLEERFRIEPETAKHFRVKQPEYDLQIYFPVLSPLGKERGGVMKYYDGGDGPKAISYKHTEEPWQAWYEPDPVVSRDEYVIVEDQLSAMRCYQLGYTAIALLGTNMNAAQIDEIKNHALGSRGVKLALDRDAFQKACLWARKHKFLTPILLERDLKDISDEEIERRLTIG